MTRLRAPFGRWDPASLSEVVARFSGLDSCWWVAGGFAIELAVGRRIRSHGDVDVLLLRRDQLVAQQALSGWQWWAADPPGSLRPWASDEVLPLEVHDIWCRPGPDDPWRIQIMIDESRGQEWVSRRDPRVRRPISTLGMASADGVPFLHASLIDVAGPNVNSSEADTEKFLIRYQGTTEDAKTEGRKRMGLYRIFEKYYAPMREHA
uniref:Amino acid transporter n=1 Tax=Streptomyces sp. NBC_01393 TaxID=2903851 RepID=A0AAU3IEY2_9ACTN